VHNNVIPFEISRSQVLSIKRSSTNTSTMALVTNILKGIKFIPPPTPLHIPETKVLEHGQQHMNVTLRTNPVDKNSSKYKKDIPFLKDGTPEEYLQWMHRLDSVIVGLNITTCPHRYSMHRQTLQGKALQEMRQ
jgi:hypothetical protein